MKLKYIYGKAINKKRAMKLCVFILVYALSVGAVHAQVLSSPKLLPGKLKIETSALAKTAVSKSLLRYKEQPALCLKHAIMGAGVFGAVIQSHEIGEMITVSSELESDVESGAGIASTKVVLSDNVRLPTGMNDLGKGPFKSKTGRKSSNRSDGSQAVPFNPGLGDNEDEEQELWKICVDKVTGKTFLCKPGGENGSGSSSESEEVDNKVVISKAVLSALECECPKYKSEGGLGKFRMVFNRYIFEGKCWITQSGGVNFKKDQIGWEINKLMGMDVKPRFGIAESIGYPKDHTAPRPIQVKILNDKVADDEIDNANNEANFEGGLVVANDDIFESAKVDQVDIQKMCINRYGILVPCSSGGSNSSNKDEKKSEEEKDPFNKMIYTYGYLGIENDVFKYLKDNKLIPTSGKIYNIVYPPILTKEMPILIKEMPILTKEMPILTKEMPINVESQLGGKGANKFKKQSLSAQGVSVGKVKKSLFGRIKEALGYSVNDNASTISVESNNIAISEREKRFIDLEKVTGQFIEISILQQLINNPILLLRTENINKHILDRTIEQIEEIENNKNRAAVRGRVFMLGRSFLYVINEHKSVLLSYDGSFLTFGTEGIKNWGIIDHEKFEEKFSKIWTGDEAVSDGLVDGEFWNEWFGLLDRNDGFWGERSFEKLWANGLENIWENQGLGPMFGFEGGKDLGWISVESETWGEGFGFGFGAGHGFGPSFNFGGYSPNFGPGVAPGFSEIAGAWGPDEMFWGAGGQFGFFLESFVDGGFMNPFLGMGPVGFGGEYGYGFGEMSGSNWVGNAYGGMAEFARQAKNHADKNGYNYSWEAIPAMQDDPSTPGVNELSWNVNWNFSPKKDGTSDGASSDIFGQAGIPSDLEDAINNNEVPTKDTASPGEGWVRTASNDRWEVYEKIGEDGSRHRVTLDIENNRVKECHIAPDGWEYYVDTTKDRDTGELITVRTDANDWDKRVKAYEERQDPPEPEEPPDPDGDGQMRDPVEDDGGWDPLGPYLHVFGSNMRGMFQDLGFAYLSGMPGQNSFIVDGYGHYPYDEDADDGGGGGTNPIDWVKMPRGIFLDGKFTPFDDGGDDGGSNGGPIGDPADPVKTTPGPEEDEGGGVIGPLGPVLRKWNIEHKLRMDQGK